jgi:hypothetical protein
MGVTNPVHLCTGDMALESSTPISIRPVKCPRTLLERARSARTSDDDREPPLAIHAVLEPVPEHLGASGARQPMHPATRGPRHPHCRPSVNLSGRHLSGHPACSTALPREVHVHACPCAEKGTFAIRRKQQRGRWKRPRARWPCPPRQRTSTVGVAHWRHCATSARTQEFSALA